MQPLTIDAVDLVSALLIGVPAVLLGAVVGAAVFAVVRRPQRPEVTLSIEGLGGGARLRLQRRLLAFTRDLIGEMNRPLRSEALSGLSPAGRGLVYQLEHAMGTLRAARAPSRRTGDPSLRSG